MTDHDAPQIPLCPFCEGYRVREIDSEEVHSLKFECRDCKKEFDHPLWVEDEDAEPDDPQCPSCDSFGFSGRTCNACGYDPDPAPPLTCDWCGKAWHGQSGDLACAEAAKLPTPEEFDAEEHASRERFGPVPYTEHNPHPRGR